jgi:hypothetical protein
MAAQFAFFGKSTGIYKGGAMEQKALQVGTVVILLLVASKLGELVRSLMDIFSL